MRWAILGSNQ